MTDRAAAAPSAAAVMACLVLPSRISPATKTPLIVVAFPSDLIYPAEVKLDLGIKLDAGRLPIKTKTASN